MQTTVKIKGFYSIHIYFNFFFCEGTVLPALFKAVDILRKSDENKSIDGNLALKVANRAKLCAIIMLRKMVSRFQSRREMQI